MLLSQLKQSGDSSAGPPLVLKSLVGLPLYSWENTLSVECRPPGLRPVNSQRGSGWPGLSQQRWTLVWLCQPIALKSDGPVVYRFAVSLLSCFVVLPFRRFIALALLCRLAILLPHHLAFFPSYCFTTLPLCCFPHPTACCFPKLTFCFLLFVITK